VKIVQGVSNNTGMAAGTASVCNTSVLITSFPEAVRKKANTLSDWIINQTAILIRIRLDRTDFDLKNLLISSRRFGWCCG
jgi:hypothetical protein